MESWFLYSLTALLLLGSQRFLYKATAELKCSSALTTALFMGTVSLLSGISYLLSNAPATPFPRLLLLALINSASFAGATILHIEALRHLPAGIIYPLNRLNLILVILASVVYFDESLNAWQWLGVVLGFGVILLLGRSKSASLSRYGKTTKGYWFVAGAILCGAISSLSCKFAAMQTSKTDFMALSYLLATGFSLAINFKWRTAQSGRVKPAILLGLLMGLLNFFGFYAFLSALEDGPLASVAMIVGMHFVIAIILSAIIFRERVTWRQSCGIAVTLLAVYLLQQ